MTISTQNKTEAKEDKLISMKVEDGSKQERHTEREKKTEIKKERMNEKTEKRK